MKQKAFNIMDYLKMRGDLAFSQDDFNCVDALILSQIVYNNVDGLVSADFKEKITMEELNTSFESSKDYEKRCNMGAMINKVTPELLKAAAKTRRFGKMKLSGFVNIIDEKEIKQFSAVTCQIEKDRYIVVYRGTDDTITGWYEDFNLVCLDEIPSQKAACNYLGKAMDALKGSFILTGHSKGGNLAVRAGMSIPAKSIGRLEAVYNYDGPGFPAQVYKSPSFLQIKDRLFSFFPHFCVVGMLFEHTNKYKIVDCAAEGILQHDPFAWKVLGPEFQLMSGFDEISAFVASSFNTWTKSLPIEDRKKFIDTFFDVMLASGVKTNYEIDQNKIVCGGKMIAKLTELSESERKSFKHALKVFVKVAKNNIPMFNVFKPKALSK